MTQGAVGWGQVGGGPSSQVAGVGSKSEAGEGSCLGTSQSDGGKKHRPSPQEPPV